MYDLVYYIYIFIFNVYIYTYVQLVDVKIPSRNKNRFKFYIGMICYVTLKIMLYKDKNTCKYVKINVAMQNVDNIKIQLEKNVLACIILILASGLSM